MESESEQKIHLRMDGIPVVIKYRELDEQAQCRVQGYVDALIEKK